MLAGLHSLEYLDLHSAEVGEVMRLPGLRLAHSQQVIRSGRALSVLFSLN